MKLPMTIPASDDVCARIARERDLALLLDLDGTLLPFAATTEAATIDPPAAELLEVLHDAGVQVVIVSGRPHGLVEPLCDAAPNAWWVAEHGTWRCDERKTWIGPPAAAEIDEIFQILAPFALVPGARIERKSLSLCLHWRLVPRSLQPGLIANASLACDEWLESHPDFERLEGVEVLEVRRSVANKGTAVEWVRSRLPAAKIIAIGDDETDEDMFAALGQDDVAIAVGRRRATTRWHLAGPADVRAFLWWLVDVRRTGFVVSPPVLELHRAAEPRPRSRLLVMSNRIPSATGGRQRQVGGLVSALEPALHAYDGIWLGWSGGETTAERRVTIDDSNRLVRASFELTPSWREHFYAGFCNRTLWPLFHGFASGVRYRDDDWTAYVESNDEFARHACELVTQDAAIWVHDYHLLLAGRDLRRRGFRGPLGLFVHIPFPQPDLLATMPWAKDILVAMSDFDVVGFHTDQWADNFRACARSFGVPTPEIGVLPIGVDPRAFVIPEGIVDLEVAGLRAVLGTRRMILGVDRLDHSKGIPERLLAFEHLLEHVPEWRGRIAFVQVSVPSRADVPEYADLRHRVETLVGRINGRFGEADWVPVRYLYRSYDHHVLAQLYRAADVALVTPLRDGLNLVAKEFVAAQDAAQPGVLVLSRFAGAAVELTDAVLTNPYHTEGLAADVDRALRMPIDERRRRHASLAAAIADRTPQQWAAAFLDRLLTTRRAVA